jgi:hypothetical protein
MKRVLLLCAALLFLVAYAPRLLAGGTYIPIRGNNFVADTFRGVSSYYNEGESGASARWQCNELPERFCREVYGVELGAWDTGPYMKTKGFAMRKTSRPEPGDIVWYPKARRGKAVDHWAVVKKFDGKRITVMEQNYVWQGQTVHARTIAFPDKTYDVFTLVDLSKPTSGSYSRKTTTSRKNNTGTTSGKNNSITEEKTKIKESITKTTTATTKVTATTRVNSTILVSASHEAAKPSAHRLAVVAAALAAAALASLIIRRKRRR